MSVIRPLLSMKRPMAIYYSFRQCCWQSAWVCHRHFQHSANVCALGRRCVECGCRWICDDYRRNAIRSPLMCDSRSPAADSRRQWSWNWVRIVFFLLFIIVLDDLWYFFPDSVSCDSKYYVLMEGQWSPWSIQFEWSSLFENQFKPEIFYPDLNVRASNFGRKLLFWFGFENIDIYLK